MRIFKIIAFCAAVTAMCCFAAFRARGYMAVGGEWTVWMAIMMIYLSNPEERGEGTEDE